MGLMDKAREQAAKAAFEGDKLRRVHGVESAISQLQDDIRLQNIKLGEAAFALFNEGQLESPQLVEICKQIVQLKEKIEERKVNLEAIRVEQFVPPAAEPATIACWSCGQPRPVGGAFCPHCGAALSATATQPTVRHCPSCGAEVPAGAAFCSICGSKVPA